MSQELPPLVPIFNTINYNSEFFKASTEGLTESEANKKYLKYPNAQGTENLLATNINGVLTVNQTSFFNRNLLMNSTTSSANRLIASSFYNFYDSSVAGTLTQNGTLYNNGGIMFLYNSVNGGTLNFALNDTGGNINTPLQLTSTGNTSNKPLTLSANNNLIFPSGTGSIQQSIVSGDMATQNGLKRTSISMTSNAPSGTGTSALDVFDNTTSRGLFILPSAGGGSLGSTTMQGDCLIGTRIINGGSLCLANWNDNLKNGVRIFTSDINNCGLTLQCGQNSTTDWTELKMAYTRGTNTTTTTFNNVINFNPTTPSAIASTRRQLIGLGTLSFTDNLNGGSSGTAISTIYTDSTLVNSLNGMYYNCGINSGYHQFSVRDGSGVVSTPVYYGSGLTSISNTLIIRSATTPTNRFDILTDASNNTNIRARSATASTNAIININCDAVNAGGTIINNAVLTITPSLVEYRRPIRFNYLTQPNDINQLGYYESYPINSITIPSNASIRNLGNFSINTNGTFNIEISLGLVGSASHNLTSCVFGCSDNSTTLPSLTTPSFYSSSLIGHNTISLSTTTESYLKINFNVDFPSTTNTIYINYILTFSGGGNTTINCVVRSTRIG